MRTHALVRKWSSILFAHDYNALFFSLHFVYFFAARRVFMVSAVFFWASVYSGVYKCNKANKSWINVSWGYSLSQHTAYRFLWIEVEARAAYSNTLTSTRAVGFCFRFFLPTTAKWLTMMAPRWWWRRRQSGDSDVENLNAFILLHVYISASMKIANVNLL